jgi:hypothetical protein
MTPCRITSCADLRAFGTVFVALTLASCTTWRPAAEFEGWTLYVEDGSTVDLDTYSAAFSAAFEAVEGAFGPFTRSVDVHAIAGSVDLHSGNHGTITGEEGAVERIEGIGDAVVPAFHAGGGGGLFAPSGIFVATPAMGTAVHELVHARISELNLSLPLWFEEGVAAVMGDGIQREGRWVMDGFSFWPWVELREDLPTDSELERLLDINSHDDHSVRDNVLVHFVGWAIVFDCMRETDDLDWQGWLKDARDAKDLVSWARTRMDRTLEVATMHGWLARVEHEDPSVRLAAARGSWKVGDRDVITLLLDQLEREEDDEVKVCLAVNALASLGRSEPSREIERRLWPTVMRALRRVELAQTEEQEAARELYRSYRRWGGRRTRQSAFDRLDRYWRE